MNIKDALKEKFEGKSIAIWGFGREGKSTYKTLRTAIPTLEITIVDDNFNALLSEVDSLNDKYLKIHTSAYDNDFLNSFDLVIKTPGISTKNFNINTDKITCQVDIFLSLFRDQCIGVTGTKGKSTTSTLIQHLMKQSGFDCILCGNIGIPTFDVLDQITDKTMIVLELSAHQLQYVKHSPRISVLLNLFQEHLDHFNSLSDYYKAKMNIAAFQQPGDMFFINEDIDTSDIMPDAPLFGHMMKCSLKPNPDCGLFFDGNRLLLKFGPVEYKLCGFMDYVTLKGEHNLYNSIIATAVCLIYGCDPVNIRKGFYSFECLEHRLQFVGIFGGMKFYNDSISTIPQATVEALKTLDRVDILLLGGFDRGIDYKCLIEYLNEHPVQYIVTMREAGDRIFRELKESGYKGQAYPASHLRHAFKVINRLRELELVCLLSPAAASYGEFKDFEERGKVFVDLARYYK